MRKTAWNIPRERLRSAHNIGPGLLAPQVPLRVIADGGQSSQSESPPRVKGSKTQVLIERDGFRELRCLDRKANESLILRLNAHARNLCLFGEPIDAVAGRGLRCGERVLADCDIR